MSGEIAEAMLDGTFCSSCGEYLGTDNGYPTMCAACAREAGTPALLRPSAPLPIYCPLCRRGCKGPQGLANHARDAHHLKVADIVKTMTGT
jgi:hypothetical protein